MLIIINYNINIINIHDYVWCADILVWWHEVRKNSEDSKWYKHNEQSKDKWDNNKEVNNVSQSLDKGLIQVNDLRYLLLDCYKVVNIFEKNQNKSIART